VSERDVVLFPFWGSVVVGCARYILPEDSPLRPLGQVSCHTLVSLSNSSKLTAAMSTPTTTITPGSWVLVTGATGYLATHIIAQFLSRGYKVRGTVRDINRASWLTSLFKSAHETGDFELVSVPDIVNTDASSFDAAVTGVAAIANVAAITSFDPDPKKVITPTVQSLLYLLEVASRSPSVREFVHTSSFLAATAPIPGNTTRVERDTYNDDAVAFAWAEPTPDTAPMRPSMVYMASKVEAEKALWRFVGERKPHFNVNSVSPSTLLGQPMDKRHVVGVPTAWLRHLYEGNTAPLRRLPACGFSFYIDDNYPR
jgi:nucleoside-diphosphate-sugar epimerase